MKSKVSGSKDVTKVLNPVILSIMTLITTLFIVFYSYILKYINNLNVKKCECSENWKRDFIKYFSMTAIGVLVIQLVLLFVERLSTLPKGLKLFSKLLNWVYILAFLVFLGVLFTYTRNLLKTKCECSEDKMINYYTLF
jgi:hypothetical protein